MMWVHLLTLQSKSFSTEFLFGATYFSLHTNFVWFWPRLYLYSSGLPWPSRMIHIRLRSSATQHPRLPPVLYHIAQCLDCIFNHFFSQNFRLLPWSFVNFIIYCSNLHSISYFPSPSSVYVLIHFHVCTEKSFYKLGVSNRRRVAGGFSLNRHCPSLCPFHLFHVPEALQIFTPHF